jgi:hypothetical protein
MAPTLEGLAPKIRIEIYRYFFGTIDFIIEPWAYGEYCEGTQCCANAREGTYHLVAARHWDIQGHNRQKVGLLLVNKLISLEATPLFHKAIERLDISDSWLTDILPYDRR